MYNIIALLSSARHLGNCDLLMRSAVSRAREMGSTVEIIKLPDLNIKPCQGCLSCIYKGQCSLADDMHSLVEKLVAADGLIIAAPTYLLSPPGMIKAICDRGLMLSPFLDQLSVKPRYAITISVAGNDRWNPLGVEMLNLLALVYGFRVLDYMEAYAPGPGEVILDEENPKRAGEMAKSLLDALMGKPHPKQPQPNQCPACFSRVFKFDHNMPVVQCPICLSIGKLNAEGQIVFTKKDDHFWTFQFRKHHLADWIIPSRDRYMANRLRIKAAIKELLGPDK